jgi:hypothetical protein
MESIKPLYSKGKTIHGAQSFERVPKDWVRYRKLRRTSRGGLFDFSTAARTKTLAVSSDDKWAAADHNGAYYGRNYKQGLRDTGFELLPSAKTDDPLRKQSFA